MKKNIAAVVALMTLGIGVAAFANVPSAPPMPSARLSIDVDVKPVAGQPGRFMLGSTVTDLENNAIVAKPQLLIGAGKAAKIEMGDEGKWTLQISVTADDATHKAAYDATFTREGKIVSKQRLTLNLNG